VLPEMAPQPETFLAVRRNRHDGVQFMQLNALTYQLLAWMRGNGEATVTEAVEAFCQALPALAEPLRAQAPGLIAHLRDSDVLVPRHAVRKLPVFPEARPEQRLPAMRDGLLG